MKGNKGKWWEIIKERLHCLDEREILLQKEVARISEKVDWLIKERNEAKEDWRVWLIVILTILHIVILIILEVFLK